MVFPKPFEVEVEEFEVGEPSSGQVLIESELTLISTGTELTALTGDFPKPSAWSNYVKYPFIPGYTCIGRVMKTGLNVADFKIGDRVAAVTPHAKHSLARAEDLVQA